MSNEPFKLVSENDIPLVLKALRKDWPQHFLLHQMLTGLDEYKKAETKWCCTLYLCGDFETGVYLNKILIKLPSREVNLLHLYSPNSNLKPVKEALNHTQVIPWDKKISFQMGQSRFTEALVQSFKMKGVVCELSSNTMFWYPPDKELNVLPILDDVFLDFLDGSFAEEMNRNWPHKTIDSELIHKEHLEKNFGLGLFLKTNKRLVCSALSNYSGGIFVLYTDPQFRGRSYAKIVVQNMVEELRRRNRIPFCTVIKGNHASEKMFSKSGFEPFVDADYIFNH